MELTELQKTSIKNYKMHGIEIELKDEVVVITQKRMINGKILSNKELYDRAKKVFPDHKIRPVVYKIELDHITPQWVKDKMNEFEIKPKDLSRQTTLDISTISLILNGERKMNKSVKALFFYYFMIFDIHQGLEDYFEMTND
ncbi:MULTISPECIES: hypothetical protein [unclassified Empedobacter]|uniref:hypothetical protein n=1 Tax=unclassified Empedobacter TaxID=2643773 RepID=UPI0025BA5197|nr:MULTISPECIES: hypothetical protein [unclassified Empedobacter]